jgi:arabinofuranan 3-O-arabinosyltransferase
VRRVHIPRAQALTAGTWLIVAALCGIRLAHPHGGLDLHVYWQAAQDMARGLSPYAVRRFVYPPFAAVVFTPLGHLSWPVAKLIGCVVAVAAIVLTVVISARALGVRPTSWSVAALTVVIAAGHLFSASVALGNVSALIAVLLACFYLAVARNHDWAAGAVLGASIAIKPMLLPVLVVPLLWGRWRALFGVVLSAAACTGVGALVVPNSGWFVTRALPYLWRAHPARFDPLNSTLSAVGHIAEVPTDVILLSRVLVIAAAAAVAVVVRIRRPRLDGVAAVTVGSAVLLAQFCAGGLTEDHFLLTLIPLFVSLVSDEFLAWPVLAWPAVVAICGLVNAPASWYGAGQRAQWAANTSVRLLGQLAALVALTVAAAATYLRTGPRFLREELG